jgi:hypothetical protein
MIKSDVDGALRNSGDASSVKQNICPDPMAATATPMIRPRGNATH